MKPKQPKIGAMYDRIDVLTQSGVRDNTGGFTESATVSKTIWADVRQKVGEMETLTGANGGEGRRNFVTDYEIITRKAAVEVGNLLSVDGNTCEVVAVVNINKAQDKIKAVTVVK